MQAIVFDLDGTLVETAPDLHLVLGEIMATIGLEAPPLAAIHSMIGDGARVLIERALTAADRELPAARIDELYDKFIERYTEEPCRASHLFPGAAAALDRLAARHARLAVCTNKPQRPSELLLQAVGLADRVGAVVGGDALDVRKPHPRHLEAAIERLQVTKDEAIMVGDSRNDLLTARALGIPCVLVSFGYTSVPARDLGADVVIDHFDELDDALRRVGRSA